MMRIYVASKARHASWWKALRAANVPIVSSWIDWPGNSTGVEPSSDAWSDHWSRCITEAANADVCLFVCNDGEQACGQLIEAGAALAAGKRVFIVSSYTWTFADHPRCRVFGSLADAITAIMAGIETEPAAAADDRQNRGRDRSSAHKKKKEEA
jgi:hypothetical protein